MLGTLIAFTAAILLFAVVPARAAYQKRSFFLTDVALVIAPMPVFLVALLTLNREAQIGFAAVVYSFLVLAAAVAALYVRVFALSRLSVNPRTTSAVILVLALGGAVALGSLVPPWYE